jgi:hypothetical protein
MKLAGPAGLKVRYVLGLYSTTAVVTGVFPPENAARYRPAAGVMAKLMDPQIRQAAKEASRRAFAVLWDTHRRQWFMLDGEKYSVLESKLD